MNTKKRLLVSTAAIPAIVFAGVAAVSVATDGPIGTKPAYAACGACNPCNPCAAAKCGACNPCNPCAAAKCGACNPCNPCAAAKCGACNPCNPCAAACNPCNPCAAACSPCNPCNPCAAGGGGATECVVPRLAKAACNPCNPCAAAKCNPCNPCAAACNPCNPCAAAKCGACNPCNPCAAAKCNPCNPCAAACNPCNPCAAACSPCNPCNPCNPCAAANPCNPCAACNPCNPCGAGGNAELTDAEAVKVYECLSGEMKSAYAKSDHPVAKNFLSYRRYSTQPYISATHGGRYVHNYANSTGRAYGAFENAGELPKGTILAKPSFSVNGKGQASLGPLFIMTKMSEGWNPDSGDWRYTMIMPNGSVVGTTKGKGAGNVKFCIGCHISVAPQQDSIMLLPDEYRVK